ncbi:MAG: HigA family addiction module antidote protein [Sphingomonadales bacterium]|nr:HigA family addiction module antidote protein [Sphingomonadales bacterium]
MNPLLKGLRPTHPGELLRETILPALDESKTAVAGALGVSRETLYRILNEERPVTPSVALRLGKALGNAPEFWLAMQARYDLAVGAERDAAILAEVRVLEAANDDRHEEAGAL